MDNNTGQERLSASMGSPKKKDIKDTSEILIILGEKEMYNVPMADLKIA